MMDININGNPGTGNRFQNVKIEQGRAQKFQQTLIDSLKKYDTDSYQVIYTTSYITEALDHSQYVVGEHYDMEHKSLKNVVKK